MNLKQVKSVVNTYNGATLTSSLDNATMNSGYMVSLKGYELKTSIKELTSEILKRYKKLAKLNTAYIGLWLDNNVLYIDISINVKDKNQAVEIARKNNQLAIYDCKNSESVYV